ncbi:hypothetical protein OIDMADRAFT_17691 [Oidiodendron maius Zn]|uniref:Uncharacterized protein n=1 Tax=Oidiodendron maius (strain Zn) TaxID=913774 RepID=A0A0C3HP64_OIDMZ|nr:hypothetical protein OIDMADRAFT_17691 [Oidiodendron maius Zn]
MTSRRVNSKETSLPEKYDANAFSPAAGQQSNITPAVPAHVIYKLLGFTLAMVICPIGTYFLTVDLVFRGNTTFAGATAAVMANVVLVAYIIVALQEDQGEEEKDRKKQ